MLLEMVIILKFQQLNMRKALLNLKIVLKFQQSYSKNCLKYFIKAISNVFVLQFQQSTEVCKLFIIIWMVVLYNHIVSEIIPINFHHNIHLNIYAHNNFPFFLKNINNTKKIFHRFSRNRRKKILKSMRTKKNHKTDVIRKTFPEENFLLKKICLCTKSKIPSWKALLV